MTYRYGIVMDPIENIHPYKDTTLVMMLALQMRGATFYYINDNDIFWETGEAYCMRYPVKVFDDMKKWCELGEPERARLGDLDIILMRKDPPFDSHFIYLTYLLEHAEMQGVLVVNKPQSLRDCNEKMFTTHFPQCTVEMLVTNEESRMHVFLESYNDCIVKPLDSMGGRGIMRVTMGDKNIPGIFDSLTQNGKRFIMMQRFIPDIERGDKRVLVLFGKPYDHALLRVPAEGDFRGNLEQGATGEGVDLSDRDRWIVDQVGPELLKRGLFFVGLDIIGDYLTEINVTSPTCVRQLNQIYNDDICTRFFDELELFKRGEHPSQS